MAPAWEASLLGEPGLERDGSRAERQLREYQHRRRGVQEQRKHHRDHHKDSQVCTPQQGGQLVTGNRPERGLNRRPGPVRGRTCSRAACSSAATG